MRVACNRSNSIVAGIPEFFSRITDGIFVQPEIIKSMFKL